MAKQEERKTKQKKGLSTKQNKTKKVKNEKKTLKVPNVPKVPKAPKVQKPKAHEKRNKEFNLYFILIFLFVMVVGLLTTIEIASKSDLRIALITDNPDDIINSVFIVFQILLFTAIILFIRRFTKKTGYLKIIEYLTFFVGCVIVFQTFLSEIIAMYIVVVLLFLKYHLEKNLSHLEKTIIWYNNILLAISIAGAGAVIGLSLGILPVIVLLIFLSVYDIIAVFFTKHMITLAQTISEKKIAMIFYIPTKKRLFKLGGGDLVLPLVLTSSFYFYLINILSFKLVIFYTILIWVCSLLGLFLTFFILKKYDLKAMPALPIQVFLMLVLVVFVLSFGI